MAPGERGGVEGSKMCQTDHLWRRGLALFAGFRLRSHEVSLRQRARFLGVFATKVTRIGTCHPGLCLVY